MINRIKVINGLLILILGWYLAACSVGSTLQTQVDFDQNAVFNDLKTYQWLDIGIEISKKLDAEQVRQLESTITSSVDGVLSKKGYSKTSIDADFFVAVQVAVNDQSQVTVMNDAYQYPMGWGAGKRYTLGARNRPRQFVYQYKEGTLIIDIVNAYTNKLMWRGTAGDELKTDRTYMQRLNNVKTAVEEILEGFPPD